MHTHKLKLLALISCLSLSLAAQGRVALVIGNGAYPHAAIPGPGATDDMAITATSREAENARAVAEALAAKGFEVLLGIDLSRAETEKALAHFEEKLQSPEVAGVIYFAGSDHVAGSKIALLAIDAELVEEEIPLEKIIAASQGRCHIFIDSSSAEGSFSEARAAFLSDFTNLTEASAPMAFYARCEGIIAEALARHLSEDMPQGAALRQLRNELALRTDGSLVLATCDGILSGLLQPAAEQGSVADVREMAAVARAETSAKSIKNEYSLMTGYNTSLSASELTLNEVFLGIAISSSDTFRLGLLLAYVKYQTPVNPWEALALTLGFDVRFPIANIVIPCIGLDVGPLIPIGNGIGNAAPLFILLNTGVDIVIGEHTQIGALFYWPIGAPFSLIGIRLSYTL